MGVNEDLLLMEISHQVSLANLTNAEVRKIRVFYRKELRRIDETLMYHVGTTEFNRKKLNRIKRLLKRTIPDLNRKTERRLKNAYTSIAKEEAAYVKGSLSSAFTANATAATGSAVIFNFKTPDISLLRTAAEGNIFQGRSLKRWMGNLSNRQLELFDRSLSTALVQGEGSGAIATRVRAQYSRSIANVNTLARTGLTAALNNARQLSFKANDVKFFRYTAVLDDRTTFICGSLDGSVYASTDQMPGIPQHMGCRSAYVATFRPDQFPTERIASTSTLGSQRNIERELRSRAKERGTTVPIERRKWQKVVYGRIPGNVNYNRYLKNAPPQFQRHVLGKERYKLFQTGRFDMKDLVNKQTGRPITLETLRKRDAQAFRLAGKIKDPGLVSRRTDLPIRTLQENLKRDLT